MEKRTEENLKSKTTWNRFLYIILFAICFNVAEIVLAAIAIVQFASNLITGRPLRSLQEFGTSLSVYLKQIADFLTYASDDKPFPMDQWPQERKIDPDQEDIIITPVKKKSSKPASSPALGNGDEATT